MADRTVYVDGTDSAPDHFLTLAAALAYQKANYPTLATNNGSGGAGYVKLEISLTTADTATFYCDGITTTAACYLWIATTAAARHAGVWTTDKYRLVWGGNEAAFDGINHLRIDGLQIGWTVGYSTGAMIHLLGQASGSDIRISNCILKGAGGAVSDYGIRIDDADTNIAIWNTVIYGFGTGDYGYGIWVYSCTTAKIWNSVVVGNYCGIRSENGATTTAKNTYAYAATDPWSGTISTSYCASSAVGELSGTGDINSIANNATQFVNVTAGSEDFHLAGTGSALYDVGDAPGGSEPLNYTTDIDGQTVAIWCIGADSYSATGQFARPASDVADGNWLNQAASNTNLYASIDEETAGDADYIRSGAAPSSDTCTVGLSSIETPIAGTVTMRIRARFL